MVFNIADILEIKIKHGAATIYNSFIAHVKKTFKEAIIELNTRVPHCYLRHDYNSDGITFLMQIKGTEKKAQSVLDMMIYEIVMYVKRYIAGYLSINKDVFYNRIHVY